MSYSPEARILETVRTKCTIFGEALKVRGQKYEQTLPENCSKSTKRPLQNANFQNFSGRACPRIPLESFLLLKLLKTNSSGKKNYLKKGTRKLVPPP